jgi:hypothetical protein
MKKLVSLMVFALMIVGALSVLTMPSASAWVGDDTPPTLTVIVPTLIPAADPEMFDAFFTYTTGNAMLALSGIAWDDMEVAGVEWFEVVADSSGYATGTDAWSIPGSAPPAEVNLIIIAAFDTSDNVYAIGIEVTRTTAPPATPGAPTIEITDPPGSTADDHIIIFGTAWDSEDDYTITWENTGNGAAGVAAERSPWDDGMTGGWSADIPLTPGDNIIRFTVTDEFGCTATIIVIVTYLVDGASPDEGCCKMFGICCNLLLEIAVVLVIVGAVLAFAPLPLPPLLKKVGWILLIIGAALLIIVLVCMFDLIQAVEIVGGLR